MEVKSISMLIQVNLPISANQTTQDLYTRCVWDLCNHTPSDNQAVTETCQHLVPRAQGTAFFSLTYDDRSVSLGPGLESPSCPVSVVAWLPWFSGWWVR